MSCGKEICRRFHGTLTRYYRLEHFKKISDVQSAAMLVLVMRAIDIDLKQYMEQNFDLTALEKTAGSRKNLSQESLMDNPNNENMVRCSLLNNVLYSIGTL